VLDEKNNVAPYMSTPDAYLGETTVMIFLAVLGIFQCLLLMWLKELLYSIYQALTGQETGGKKKQK